MAAHGLFLVRMDVAHDHQKTFNEVYDGEHVPNLTKVPGVRRESRSTSASTRSTAPTCRSRSCGTTRPTSDAGSRTCGRTPTTRSGSSARSSARAERGELALRRAEIGDHPHFAEHRDRTREF